MVLHSRNGVAAPMKSRPEARTPDAVRARVNEMCARLDPVALLRDIRTIRRSWPVSPTRPRQPIPGRRHRPNSFCRACESRGKKKGRSARPTGQLRSQSESDGALIRWSRLRAIAARMVRGRGVADRQRTSVQTLGGMPGCLPEQVLRTLQPRPKSWRSEQASALLFSSREHEAQTNVIDTSPESPPLLDEGTAV
ncbi:hypothetical protein GGD64_007964 [Bradyrhizobium sp. CIR3A]|nr:hypothetical protein [Bradyrhizobium sp. CIR3A]